MISELLKQQENVGERHSLYFYRDTNAVEADLLIETAQEITVIEIKAGQTITDALLSPARRVKETLSAVKKTQAVTVYGGDAEQRRSDIRVVPWNRLQGLT